MFTQRIIVKNDFFFLFVSSTLNLLFCCHIVVYIIEWDFYLAFNDILYCQKWELRDGAPEGCCLTLT